MAKLVLAKSAVAFATAPAAKARAPCLICGKFKHGETDDAIARNISEGIPNTAMGAFGDKLNAEEVKAVVVFLRAQQKKKAEAEQ